ncbi:hypothetical protein GCM10010329_26380 [Streptomyces spiroverticillatus]|uniref:DUF4349 domain-containing protein n=2 Tax=Streptomyces finlayi TaxID=67296 RepID=A0A919C8N8_9ACTN|nr:hypothetical protein GCM10010329_26380 [Streptomyces spiroverticillatus]GHC87181.1 hypothetical protein GCM10010334_18790 [Streptomyces finlayi]
MIGAAVVAATLAVGGCGASDGASSSSDRGGGKAAAPEAAKQPGAQPGADAAKPGAGSGSGADAAKPGAPSAPKAPQQKAPAAKVHVIRTAELHMEVKSTIQTLTEARAMAETAGGYVGNESTERDNGNHIYSRIALRVPQDKFSSTLAELERKPGKILARKADAKDVTGQVVDLASRIKSQRVSVARVQEFMDRASKLSDVVTLEAELSNRQAELESLLAQENALADQTSMSTITLVLTETPPKKKPEQPKKEDEEPGFLDALGGGWDAFLTTVRWIAVVVGAVAPFAAALALLWLLWRKALAPRFPRRVQRGHAPAFPSYPAAPVAPAPHPAPAPAEGESPDEK